MESTTKGNVDERVELSILMIYEKLLVTIMMMYLLDSTTCRLVLASPAGASTACCCHDRAKFPAQLIKQLSLMNLAWECLKKQHTIWFALGPTASLLLDLSVAYDLAHMFLLARKWGQAHLAYLMEKGQLRTLWNWPIMGLFFIVQCSLQSTRWRGIGTQSSPLGKAYAWHAAMQCSLTYV